MQGHIMTFVPNPPRKDKGITHIQCLESSSRLGEEIAHRMMCRCGTLVLSKAGVWEFFKFGNHIVHFEGSKVIEKKLEALNKKKARKDGGDSSAKEMWQHDVGIIEQDGIQLERLRI